MKKRNVTTSKSSAGSKKKPTHEAIARLAHALYEKEGRPEGKDLEHWFNAESMIEANFGYGESHTEPDFFNQELLNH